MKASSAAALAVLALFAVSGARQSGFWGEEAACVCLQQPAYASLLDRPGITAAMP
jgi:hypothetical protein